MALPRLPAAAGWTAARRASRQILQSQQSCISMELNLKDRVAFITGANRGIGAGIAKAFAAEGIHLGLFARNVPQCQEVADQIRASSNIRIDVQHIDFREPDTLAPAVRRAVDALGGV